jgi:hypothetical protein
MFIDTDKTRKLRQKYNLQMQKSGIKTFQDMDRIELEATAVSVALSGAVADWPARYVFKILEDIDKDEAEMKYGSSPDSL